MRLVDAEFLKLRRRTGLVLATVGVTTVPAFLMVLVDDSGAFADHFGVVALLTVVAGILAGAAVGTSDETSGVFRELVVTGRSRLDLFAARVPAGLALVLLAAGAGFVLVGPEEETLVKCAAWLALVAATSYALSLGVATVVGTPGQSIAMLLALWLIVTPFVQNVESLAWLRDGLVITGLDRVMPRELTEGDPVHTISLVGAIALLLAWTVVPLLAGAWRTLTRDA
jgi:hypothetical protein